ncbi:MAG: hypothetical protein J2P55_14135 [Rhizobiales bacterium]|nr:hypothetical protein [Hyphomicrobiales bacterium]
MIAATVLALELLRLMTPDGLPVDINPNEIVSLRPPREDDKRTLNSKVQCVLFTADSKFVAVTNECDEIRWMLHNLNSE